MPIEMSGLYLHKTAVPIDHPDGSITLSKWDQNIMNKNFDYWLKISEWNIIHSSNPNSNHTYTLINMTFSNYAYITISHANMRTPNRNQYPTWGDEYTHESISGSSPSHYYVLWVNGNATQIASESVTLNDWHYMYGLDANGSTFKAYREWIVANTITSQTPKFTATDTTYATGYLGIGMVYGTEQFYYPSMYIMPAFSPGVPAQVIVEVDIIGSGTTDDMFRPNIPQKLVEIGKLNLPREYAPLYREYKRYLMLRSKGFTDEEIELLLGKMPPRYIDLGTVTYGAFDYKYGQSTMVIAVYGDNELRTGAIEDLKSYAKSKNFLVLRPPRDYQEAVEQYRQLKQQHPEWIAGKDNWAYQMLGWADIEPLAVADYYYGFVQGTYKMSELEKVPYAEEDIMRWLAILDKVSVPSEERDKAKAKLKAVLKR